jgi:hypothetical protein
MNKRNSTKFWVPVALLVSVVAVAEEWHPSGFQPAPVFEDEGLTRKAMPPRTPPAAPKAAEPPVAASVKPAGPAPMAARFEAGTPQAKPAPAAAAAPSSGGWTEVLATNFPLGLIVLALAGYVFWSTRRAGGAVRTGSPTPPVPPANSAKTGVARYLEGLSAETGVAKYLRKLGG